LFHTVLRYVPTGVTPLLSEVMSGVVLANTPPVWRPLSVTRGV
jgi:hypothetical protein